MLILGIDCETTGLDPKVDAITEIGAVMWDCNLGQPVKIFSELVQHKDMPEISPEITRLTGITAQMLKDWGVPSVDALKGFWSLLMDADYLMAHNAPFDRTFIEAWCKSHGWDVPKTPWIDTCVDVPYPAHIATRKQTYLCAEHGFLNPFAHRAVFDVLAMLRLVSQYDIEEIVKLAGEENVELRALVAKPWNDDGKSTGIAKEVGYRWDGNRKLWTRIVKESRVLQELQVAERAGIKAVVLKNS